MKRKIPIKALVYRGPGLKSLEDVPDPEIVAPSDALVKIIKTTICGSDLHILKGEMPSVLHGIIENSGNAFGAFND